MITTQEDPVIVELTGTLHEWHKILLSLYLDNQSDLFDKVASILIDLVDLRSELISVIKQTTTTTTTTTSTTLTNTTTTLTNRASLQQEVANKAQQIVSLKSDIICKIDAGNRLLGLDIVPRDVNFKQVDPVELSPVKLFRLHAEAAGFQVSNHQKPSLQQQQQNIIAQHQIYQRNSILNDINSNNEISTYANNHNNPTSICNIYGYQEFCYNISANNNINNNLNLNNNNNNNNLIINQSLSIDDSSQSSTTTTSSSIYSGTTSIASGNNNFHSIHNNINSQQSLSTSHHLQLCLKSHCFSSLPPDELVEVYFSIVDNVVNNNVSTPITEKFLVQIKGDDIVCGLPNTIFTNIGQLNNRDVCLYVQAYRIGKMTLMESHKTAFGKQPSALNLQATSTNTINLNGSTNSVCSTTTKYSSNTTMSRPSTLNYFHLNPKYRRPFGTATIFLKEFTKAAYFKETPVSVKVVATNESEFSQLQDPYSKRNQSIKLNQNLPNINIDLSIRFITTAHESILKNLPDYCITEKRGFPDVVMPGDFKNDLFLTLESAEFEKGGKSISKNIEASISLIDKNGLAIPNCISPASNCDKLTCYNSCVFYHSNSPRWNESIKINVPLSEFDTAHIRIEFRHCSTKEREKRFLGFSFLPLSDEDGTVIADKSHDLYLYKCDPQIWEDESLNLCKYTTQPYGPNATIINPQKLSSQNNFSHSNREIVTVSSFLLSTKLTQNSDLLNLLKWRELIKRNNRDFEDALKKILVLKGEEIVKFLQDILDTLFDTFTLFLTNDDDKTGLIFKVLVHIFLLLEEPKFQHFKPVLDTYASGHFSATLVHKGLLACVKKCLEYSTVVERHIPIQKCFKALKPIFQFIVQSKLLLSKATGDHNDEPFLNDLRHLFKLFELLLANNNPNLIPIQVTFLGSFPGTLDQLIKVLSAQELSKVVTSLAGSVGFNLPPPLSKAKLIFMKEASNSVLIRNQDTRLQITENFCKHLDFYIKHDEEVELCHDVLEILVVRIHDYHWTSIYRLYQLTKNKGIRNSETKVPQVMNVIEISMQTKTNQIQANQLDLTIMGVTKELEPFVNLLNPLLELLDKLAKDFNNQRYLIQRYCTCILTIMKLMSKVSFDHFMKRRKIEYSKLFNLFRTFRGTYNRDWSMMQLTSHAILEQPIEEIFRDIRIRVETNLLNRQLSSYIKLLVDFVTHPTLQLEVFSERKRHYILNVFGDMRMKFANQLMRFWSELNEGNICDLTPTSVQSFLDATLLPNQGIQKILIPVFYDMINAEDHLKSNSRQIERCLIDYLDLLLNLDKGNLNYADNFETTLMAMIEEKSPIWKSNGISLVRSFSRLMRLLIDYRYSLESYDVKSKQMHCLVELSNFYRLQGRTDLHLRYLFKLCHMHLEAKNNVEAAFCLKLYADEIRWFNRDRKVEVIEGFRPEELEWVRKESLYSQMINYFDLGKCWEEAIGLCKELANFYESQYDYAKVSSTFKKLASFFDNILNQYRPEREYFRVEFLGASFPDYVRDKEFVYRGGEYERLEAFIQRMREEFPDAQLLNSKARQTITRDRPGKYMVISNVKPAPLLKELFKTCHKNMDDKIIHYYLNNRLDTFTYDKPIIKGNTISNGAHEGEPNVKNLWIGRYRLKLKKRLPDILPWSEVVSQEYEELSPINNALEMITNKNVELSELILSYKNDPNKQVSPLTMALLGTIDAPVNGGPSLYVNAFLKRQPGEPENVHEPADLVIKLRELIRQQYNILDTGLAVHSKLVPPEVMPLHNRLVEKLRDTYDSFMN